MYIVFSLNNTIVIIIVTANILVNRRTILFSQLIIGFNSNSFDFETRILFLELDCNIITRRDTFATVKRSYTLRIVYRKHRIIIIVTVRFCLPAHHHHPPTTYLRIKILNKILNFFPSNSISVDVIKKIRRIRKEKHEINNLVIVVFYR